MDAAGKGISNIMMYGGGATEREREREGRREKTREKHELILDSHSMHMRMYR